MGDLFSRPTQPPPWHKLTWNRIFAFANTRPKETFAIWLVAISVTWIIFLRWNAWRKKRALFSHISCHTFKFKKVEINARVDDVSKLVLAGAGIPDLRALDTIKLFVESETMKQSETIIEHSARSVVALEVKKKQYNWALRIICLGAVNVNYFKMELYIFTARRSSLGAKNIVKDVQNMHDARELYYDGIQHRKSLEVETYVEGIAGKKGKEETEKDI